MYILVIKQLVIMLLIAALSFFVSRKFKFGENEKQFVSKILLFFINPCLILNQFNIDFEAEKFKSFGVCFVLSFIVHLVMVSSNAGISLSTASMFPTSFSPL